MGIQRIAISDPELASFDDIIDVRAPSEFAEDHIPGAINLPVLSDAERAEVGTIYVQESPFKARKIGAALVAQNAAAHLQGALADKPGSWRAVIYCWRGGQRSGSLASILEQIGWRVAVVEGGYQSYRRQVVAALHDGNLTHHLMLLDGNTGTAKTEMLHRLAARGAQIIDLEGIARHRGSVFGVMHRAQPSQKMFETRLLQAIRRASPERPIIVEAESNKIGNLYIPPAVWSLMRRAPRIRITAPLSKRAEYLVRAYSDIVADGDGLNQTLNSLRSMQGHEQVEKWLSLAKEGAFTALASDLMARHYDPRYAKSQSRGGETYAEIELSDLDAQSLDDGADQILALVKASVSA